MNQTRNPTTQLSRNQALYLLILIFLFTVAIRLPGLDRPISKHHEFVSACNLINSLSWRQAGGGAEFHYIPVFNFQNAGDLNEQRAVNIDDHGNQLYLSYGPGMFVIANFVYQLFHLPLEPIYLRIFNIILGLLTVILSFFFFDSLFPSTQQNRWLRSLLACILFMFSPGNLWYFGNGYVNTATMMPFVILMAMTLTPMLRSSEKITPLRLLALSGLIIILVYIDWFVAFFCFITGVYGFVRSFRDKKYWILNLVLGASLLAGAALVFWELASYAGTDRVALYWKLRFLSRGFVNPNDDYFHMLPRIAFNLATCYLPLLILLTWSFARYKIRLWKIPLSGIGDPGPSGNKPGFPGDPSGLSGSELLFSGLFTCSLLAYLLVFIDWSSRHEFSVIPAGFLLAYLGARWLPLRSGTRLWLIMSLFCMLSLAQYFYINRIGARSRDGMPYDTFEIFGKQLRQIPPDYKIFSDLKEICPMIEYYARRNLTLVNDSVSAKQLMRDWGLKRAVWAATNDFTLRSIDTLRVE